MKIFKSLPLLLTIICIVTAPGLMAQDLKVENVRFLIEDGKVAIYYDIKGEEGEEYDITLYLLNEDDPDYRYEPELITGDIGEVKYFGLDKKIVWDVQKEFPVAGCQSSLPVYPADPRAPYPVRNFPAVRQPPRRRLPPASDRWLLRTLACFDNSWPCVNGRRSVLHR